MQLIIIAVGQKMPKWVQNGFEEYAKRMPPDCKIVLKEVRAADRSPSKSPEVIMQLEKSRIEAALPKNAYVVALDEHGRDINTVQLSERISAWQLTGRDIAFVIGGADGLDKEFKNKAEESIRLSSLTLPHGMVRVLLAEQLYRAWTITQNHPYHRI